MESNIRTVKQLYDDCVKYNMENCEIKCVIKTWENERYVGDLMSATYPYTYNDQDKCINLYFDQKYKLVNN